ncbi:hypothetical protein SASPL_142018 [Salvia splendens]|uniref:sulfiredoxin n=1 Tax=Salvia splendens TaxID=180675 RepID=A0A8X8WJT8_SALSN|nr:hypothetical protein SASPL_142018 [Salvia splendens]
MANFLLNLPNNFRALSFQPLLPLMSLGIVVFHIALEIEVNAMLVRSPPSVPQQGGPVILELPLDKIRRPLMRTRSNDPRKVKELMDSISEIGLQVPIDVLQVDGEYYGFSGCHRYEAHQRLGLPTIRCKVRRGTKETLRHHLR